MGADKNALREAKDAVKAFPFEWSPQFTSGVMLDPLLDITQMGDEVRRPAIKGLNVKLDSVPVPRLDPNLAGIMQPALRANQDASYPSCEDTMALFQKRTEAASTKKYGESKEKRCKGVEYYAGIMAALGAKKGENCGRTAGFMFNARDKHKVIAGALYHWKPAEKKGGEGEQAGRWQLVVPFEEVHRMLCWAHGSCKKGDRHGGRDKMFKLLGFFFDVSNFERNKIVNAWLQMCRGCNGKGNGRSPKEQDVALPEEETATYQDEGQDRGTSDEEVGAILLAAIDASQQPTPPPAQWSPPLPQLYSFDLPLRPHNAQQPLQEAPELSPEVESPFLQASQPLWYPGSGMAVAASFGGPEKQGFGVDPDVNFDVNFDDFIYGDVYADDGFSGTVTFSK